ncbi:MAG: hypothetical protein U1F67_23615 [Rubrivivax sp.]
MNQPTSVVWQDGAVRRYHYENAQFPQLLTGRTDELGVRIGTYTYNTSGQLERSAGPNGMNAVDFVYIGGATLVTDRSGATPVTSTYTWETAAGVIRPIAVSAPCPQCGSTSAATAYTATGEVARRVDHDGRITFYTYDAKGRETERATYPAAYNSATKRPALSVAERVVSTKWHATWNLPTQIAEPARVTAYTYGTGGRLTGESWTATTDATGAAKFNAVKTGSTITTGIGYNSSNLPTTLVTQETAQGATAANETGRWSATYKADGSLSKITDAISAATATVTTDASGRITKTVSSNGAQASFVPNLRGYMIRAATPQLVTEYILNETSQTSEIRFSDGRWIRYTYDMSGRLVRMTDSAGLVEQFAGVGHLRSKDSVRAALAWLAWRGNELAAALVPPARAQGQLVVPAGIVLGLIFIVESGRRGASAAPSGRACCGPDGPSAPNGSDDSSAAKWARQIAILLTEQMVSAPPPAGPMYDKAGLLVSPKSCLAAPGYCDPNKHKDLQNEVDNACKSTSMRCGGGMSRSTLLSNAEMNRACAVARDRLNKTCFAGGDVNHRNAAIDAWRAVTNCESLLERTP